ncbi:DUF5683 domain-containing protein [Agriterribacter sp.]|uniref:DUF5683 domain-containing protein n=1 Tax=Agriterribacter sp. TaxID=2821509 RepID=UPI002C8B00BD|nr:DUF5683 domain-containing protein [Agriterribacter sp.]HRO45142.1 DUF5683 domain-containing protein [Agriterribacter sp.]
MHKQHVLLILLLAFCALQATAQNDTTITAQPADSIITAPARIAADSLPQSVSITDTSKKRSPAGTAALLSAILPGAGQVYNKKYWKLPLVYGALAFPAYTFVDNLRWFQRTRYAFNVLSAKDTANYENVYVQLQPLVKRGDKSGLQNYRNDFRRNVDYSVLAFLLLWGLNVVDATVDAHLKDFNITDDLSLQIKPGYMPIANTAGIGIVLNIGKNHTNRLSPGR